MSTENVYILYIFYNGGDFHLGIMYRYTEKGEKKWRIQ